MNLRLALLTLVACGPDLTVVGFDAALPDGGPDAGPFDAGPPICDGVPAASCLSFGAADCRLAPGCFLDDACMGSAQSCSTFTNPSRCDGQDGCSWNAIVTGCTGSPRRCDSLRSRSQCLRQDGCRTRDTCNGVLTDCAGIRDADLCERVAGCDLIE